MSFGPFCSNPPIDETKNTFPTLRKSTQITQRVIDRQTRFFEKIVARNSWALTDARKHVHRLGGTLHLDWMSATLHVAAFRVGRVLHIWLVTRKDPVLKLVSVCHLCWNPVSGQACILSNSRRRCHLIKSCSFLSSFWHRKQKDHAHRIVFQHDA